MKRACVIGWPIEHSRSPAIHGYWLKHYGIDGTYTKQAVPPQELGAFLSALADKGFAGCNVTVPHKEAAFAIASDTDASARAVGAANTLWLEDGRLHAANTDTYGYMTYLDLRAAGWQRRDAPVSILGAGGAARAIAFGFLESGVGEIRIFNRTRERSETLARLFGSRIRVCDWSERSALSREAAVLVNTTSLGLKGEGALGIDFAGFHPQCVVSDIVYVPLVTGLIKDAAGARAAHSGRARHVAAPGRAGFRKMVRQASGGDRRALQPRCG